MHPLKQLRKLIVQNSPNNGKVVKAGSSLLIATASGPLSVTPLPGDATKYQVGDEVTLSNGNIVGRKRTNPTVYVL